MTITVRNNSGSQQTWVNKFFEVDETYIIPSNRLHLWRNNDSAFAAISNGTLVVGNSTEEFSDKTTAWNWLLGERPSPFSNGKLAIHESSRPFTDVRLGTYYVGVDDDLSTGEYLGSDEPAFITVDSADSTISKDFEFDPQHGEVWVHEGYAWWSGAGPGDNFSVAIISNPTPLATSNVSLDLEVNGKLILPASGGAGTGTHGFAGQPVPVFKPSSNGFWNLDNGSLQPVASQTGQYDLYTSEVWVDYIIAKVPVLGTTTNYVKFQSADTSQIPPGYKLRVILNNVSGNTWSIGFFMTVYRELPEPIPL